MAGVDLDTAPMKVAIAVNFLEWRYSLFSLGAPDHTFFAGKSTRTRHNFALTLAVEWLASTQIVIDSIKFLAGLVLLIGLLN